MVIEVTWFLKFIADQGKWLFNWIGLDREWSKSKGEMRWARRKGGGGVLSLRKGVSHPIFKPLEGL